LSIRVNLCANCYKVVTSLQKRAAGMLRAQRCPSIFLCALCAEMTFLQGTPSCTLKIINECDAAYSLEYRNYSMRPCCANAPSRRRACSMFHPSLIASIAPLRWHDLVAGGSSICLSNSVMIPPRALRAAWTGSRRDAQTQSSAGQTLYDVARCLRTTATSAA
jgi:hypothetical protein